MSAYQVEVELAQSQLDKTLDDSQSAKEQLDKALDDSQSAKELLDEVIRVQPRFESDDDYQKQKEVYDSLSTLLVEAKSKPGE